MEFFKSRDILNKFKKPLSSQEVVEAAESIIHESGKKSDSKLQPSRISKKLYTRSEIFGYAGSGATVAGVLGLIIGVNCVGRKESVNTIQPYYERTPFPRTPTPQPSFRIKDYVPSPLSQP